jgi:hypothetical protein
MNLEWLLVEQCVEATYLLPKVKEVKSSVNGQECHFYNDIDARGHSSTKG